MWGRGSQLGSGEMAKHKPYKLACSTVRLEGPALRKCNTKHAKPSRQDERTKSHTLKAPKNRELNRVVDWWKTKTGIAKDENETWKHTHPHSRDLPCVGLIHALFPSRLMAFRAAQSTHSQFLSDCFALTTLIEHRYQSSKHGKQSHNKHDKPKQHKIIVDPASK